MPPTLSRRPFRFSLRTFFVAVTVLACLMGWLAWNWHIVRERQALRDEIALAGATFDLRTSHDHFFINLERNPMPFPRKWLGDSREAGIVVPEGFDDRQIARVRAVFPEAWVHRPSE